jgi:hypothetical protein
MKRYQHIGGPETSEIHVQSTSSKLRVHGLHAQSLAALEKSWGPIWLRRQFFRETKA